MISEEIEKRKYNLSDISIIIPTYNRSKDLHETLFALRPFFPIIREIIVVDQSNNKEAKYVVNSFKNKKIKYVFSKTPSITIARNLGVNNVSKNSKLLCFIDDDVNLGKSYFEEILNVFNEFPEARGVAGYVPQGVTFSKLENFLRRIFFISYLSVDEARIISAYGNTYPASLHKLIQAQWLPGVNTVYKKEVFKKQKFDEHLLGYTVAEDIGFSYELWENHPESLFITPFAPVTHRISLVEREPSERISYINQVDHWYFYYRHLQKLLSQRIIFFWSLFGISLLGTVKMVVTRKKIDYLKWRYFFISSGYCIAHSKEIQNGNVRGFITRQ